MRSAALLTLAHLALAAPSKRASPAPLHVPRSTGNNLVEGKYIVKLYDNAATDSLHSTMTTTAAEPDHVYDVPGFKGFASALTPEEIENLQNHPDVEFIEQDSIMRINAFVTQSSSTWGLARVSHHSRSATGYVYDSSAGAGTCSYIVDTGIFTTHSDFGGRATWLANYADSSNSDGNGHGTHVAGTVGSATYGVAKQTKLYAVKVLDSSGSGTTSGVVAAHVHGKPGILAAVKAGVTTVEHVSFADEECIELIKEKGTVYVATRTIVDLLLKAGGKGLTKYQWEKAQLCGTNHLRAYKMAIKAGVPIALGTDTAPGFNMAMELDYAVQAGLSPLEAIKAATANGPLSVGAMAPKTGQLKVGYEADILGLLCNPVEDVKILQQKHNIGWVWKGGRLFKGPGVGPWGEDPL
ncbi:hypothetical protein CHU98_g3651 [Xylaria longipes]|nr:hypothetical protein CHU98_g3651 [Xylaria longipes]